MSRSSRLNMVQGWWFAGEGNATAVYRQSYRDFFLMLVISVGIALLIHAIRAPLVFVVIMLVPVAGLLQKRRAIIFTDGAMLYRPALAKPTRICLADVVSAEPCTTYVYTGGKFPIRVAGICFHLKGGEELKVPLDFPESKLIQGRIFKLVHFTRLPDFEEPPSTHE